MSFLRVQGTGCDDGDDCTEEDACSAGKCVGEAKDCDDGDKCTVDSCVAGECKNVEDDTIVRFPE